MNWSKIIFSFFLCVSYVVCIVFITYHSMNPIHSRLKYDVILLLVKNWVTKYASNRNWDGFSCVDEKLSICLCFMAEKTRSIQIETHFGHVSNSFQSSSHVENRKPLPQAHKMRYPSENFVDDVYSQLTKSWYDFSNNKDWFSIKCRIYFVTSVLGSFSCLQSNVMTEIGHSYG